MDEAGTISPDVLKNLSMEILALFGKQQPTEDMISDVVLLVQKYTGIESIGVRLADGPDFPYYFTRGFDQDFVEMEMHLCARDQVGELIRDSNGNPVLECMCGNVICGRTDPELPFFTEGGSFWSNCTTELLASTNEQERQARTRNRCNSEGYESVALIPIKTERKCHGLLQLNDHRKNMFSLEEIGYLEGVAGNIGLLFAMQQMRQELAEKAADVTRIAQVRAELLMRLTEELKREHGHHETTGKEEKILQKIDTLLQEVEELKGIIPICSHCKRVRVDSDYWMQVEKYVSARSQAEFSHTYCPECYEEWKKEFVQWKKELPNNKSV